MTKVTIVPGLFVAITYKGDRYVGFAFHGRNIPDNDRVVQAVQILTLNDALDAALASEGSVQISSNVRNDNPRTTAGPGSRATVKANAAKSPARMSVPDTSTITGTSTGPRTGPRTASDPRQIRAYYEDLRAWAAEKGIEVGKRGVISPLIMHKYFEETGKPHPHGLHARRQPAKRQPAKAAKSGRKAATSGRKAAAPGPKTATPRPKAAAPEAPGPKASAPGPKAAAAAPGPKAANPK